MGKREKQIQKLAKDADLARLHADQLGMMNVPTGSYERIKQDVEYKQAIKQADIAEQKLRKALESRSP